MVIILYYFEPNFYFVNIMFSVILMKHVRQLAGDFGIEKNTLTNFLRREMELDYSPNFLDLSCDEMYIAVAGTSNSKPSITVYKVEELITQVNLIDYNYLLISLMIYLFYFRVILFH